MKIQNWHVMTKGNERSYFYGDLSDFETEELEGYSEVPYGLWIAEDFSEILGNILEDRNHHWMTDVPRLLLDVLESTLPEENTRMFIMKKFAERMENEKF